MKKKKNFYLINIYLIYSITWNFRKTWFILLNIYSIYICVYYKLRVIYKNIVSCCTKNSNLKKKSNLSCNSLKFKSITQDENNACKIRACEVFVFVCGVKISFRKKNYSYRLHRDIRICRYTCCRSNSNEMFCARDKHRMAIWQFIKEEW